MTRIRCQGCMAKDPFIDLSESAEYPGGEGWHYCLDCGNVLNPVSDGAESPGPTGEGLGTPKW